MAKISLELIQELRGKTGIGMMDCKNALAEAGGDVEKAIDLLRKKGADVASKRAGKDTINGRIHAYIHPGANIGVMIEIACETDFAANTEDMTTLAHNLCLHITAANPLAVNPEELDQSLIEKEREILREQLVKAGKPENLIDKIVENKLEKFYETSCLLKQKYIKNDKISVSDYINEVIAKIRENIHVKRFIRYHIGA